MSSWLLFWKGGSLWCEVLLDVDKPDRIGMWLICTGEFCRISV